VRAAALDAKKEDGILQSKIPIVVTKGVCVRARARACACVCVRAGGRAGGRACGRAGGRAGVRACGRAFVSVMYVFMYGCRRKAIAV
jgi:hypothetical protein